MCVTFRVCWNAEFQRKGAWPWRKRFCVEDLPWDKRAESSAGTQDGSSPTSLVPPEPPAEEVAETRCRQPGRTLHPSTPARQASRVAPPLGDTDGRRTQVTPGGQGAACTPHRFGGHGLLGFRVRAFIGGHQDRDRCGCRPPRTALPSWAVWWRPGFLRSRGSWQLPRPRPRRARWAVRLGEFSLALELRAGQCPPGAGHPPLLPRERRLSLIR